VIKPKRPSPTESPLRFEIDPEPLAETLTAWGGVPLVVQAFRSLGVPASVQQRVQITQRERSYDEATMVESFVVLNGLCGECVDDFQHLREDAGLKEMLGHEIPSPEAARQFLNQFHAEEKIKEAKQGRGPEQIAFIPEETDALAGRGYRLYSAGRRGQNASAHTFSLDEKSDSPQADRRCRVLLPPGTGRWTGGGIIDIGQGNIGFPFNHERLRSCRESKI